ncbi:MAPK/MAK/MRK overlapping kinase isoform X2 [Nilaparvata lugens]|uniref:MAPK/MAK/MRK overlapping kinase isoform X2 n=1 Tax=Nilaparvata lugens TaxID=108931 RepID=UPI00193CBA3E|nr:MAPK/MAK/MRK overlapping kinase isoform X2 [Nilaparvata lugens]
MLEYMEYRVLNKIGEGTFSEVLRCQNRESGHLVAAKRLRKSFLSPSEARDLPEVVALKKVSDHPNILHLIETHFEHEHCRVTLIFELMDMSIYDMMKTHRRNIPEVKVKNYLYQILKGINHLHINGLFHRDIKPENILIKGDLIKIADLGSVCGTFRHRPFTEYISTRWYRSPECLLTCGYYDSKMDIWSVGCVFFELLTLKPLFPGSNELDQISRIHMILGTPSPLLLNKFKKHKSQNIDVIFPQRAGTGLTCLLPNVSDSGRDILKNMLTYDPRIRSSAARLLDNRYFNDLRDADILRRRLTSNSTVHSERSNPVLLSFMATEKRRRPKPSSGMVSKHTVPKKEKLNIKLEKLPKINLDQNLHLSRDIRSTKSKLLKKEPKTDSSFKNDGKISPKSVSSNFTSSFKSSNNNSRDKVFYRQIPKKPSLLPTISGVRKIGNKPQKNSLENLTNIANKKPLLQRLNLEPIEEEKKSTASDTRSHMSWKNY